MVTQDDSSPGWTIRAQEWNERLARADRGQLTTLAEECLGRVEHPPVILGPDVGTVVMTVREPVEAIRFQLTDVLVTQCEVEHRGQRGWSMRMGNDPVATLAAAICEAELWAQGPLAAEIQALCDHTAAEHERTRARERHELAATVVRFEEMGE